MPKRNRLFHWQILTVLLMLLGYSGYYLCRSNFSVALPLITDELVARGLSPAIARIRLGTVASLGVAAYAIAKFPAGALSDYLGGRRNFLVGMLGSVLCTFLFALSGGLPLFTLAWVANRLVQSLGWAGMVKVSSHWFPFHSYGGVMAMISLSFLFGDAAARTFLAGLIGNGLGWRGVFLVAAATLLLFFLLNFVLLKETPADIGESEASANPMAVIGEREGIHSRRDLWRILRTLCLDYGFQLVCILSFTFTLVRETFNLWTPTYFAQVIRLNEADAARASALFPFSGGLSVLLCGIVSDRLKQGGRAAIMLYGLLLAGAVLFLLGRLDFRSSRQLPVGLVMLVGFLMIGPYSYLAGAISLDLGGKQGGATTSGIVDGVGYFGGILAGDSVARVSVAYGWQGAFTILGVVVWLSSVAAFFYQRHIRMRVRGHRVLSEVDLQNPT